MITKKDFMKLITAQFFTFLMALVFLTGCSDTNGTNDTTAQLNSSGDNSEPVIYELRTYTTYEGKLDDLHTRFENHTMALFEKHGMTNIMYWSPEDPDLSDNTLIYLLSHKSREAAEQSWEGFRNDDEWQQVSEASRTGGPIVERVESVYMKKTPYSPHAK